PGFALSSECSLSDTHLVRMACVMAARMSNESGPPTSTGGPTAMAMQREVGRLIGKLQLITIDKSRPADAPAMVTVLLPVTIMPSLPGLSKGAKETPGGMGK